MRKLGILNYCLSIFVLFYIIPDSSCGNSVILSVTVEEGVYKLNEGIAENWAAKANFTDTTPVDGWSYLEVESSDDFPDVIQAYAAGFVEGASSKSIIYNSWKNTQEGYCQWKGQKFCDNLYKFLQINLDWMRDMIRDNRFTSSLWHHVELVLSQLMGLSDGYNENVMADQSISLTDFLLMNLSGDLEDLENALNSTYHKMPVDEWLNSPDLFGDGHCSAIIKVLPGNTDILSAHVTWNSFQSMLRIQKRYILKYHLLEKPPNKTSKTSPIVPGSIATFSSYPTYLHSGDDFYVLSSGLMSMETTIGNSNPLLWSNVKPVGELQEWIRVLLANRLATSGKQWVDLFSQYNSGTYNNQWMVVDYKRFKPGNSIKDDTLWVLEQIPGRITSGDQSGLLRNQSYWPSYNTPFYKDIFNLSGGPLMVAKYGDWFSYDHTPRANIFRRDHGKVKDLPTLKTLMRYNNFKQDPLSACDCQPPYSGENAISARNDLNPANGTYPFAALGHRSHAGTDVKMTSASLFFKMRFQAVAGPTNDQQPTFVWSKSDFNNDTPHYGHPDTWDFDLVEHKWIW